MSRELNVICPKLTKQTLKIHQGLYQAASNLVVQIRTEEIGLNKFLYSKNMPRFDSPEYPCRRVLQSAKHLLVECQVYNWKKNKTWEVNRKNSAVGRISWEEMLTKPKFTKKVAQFIKSLGLINQFKSTTFD